MNAMASKKLLVGLLFLALVMHTFVVQADGITVTVCLYASDSSPISGARVTDAFKGTWNDFGITGADGCVSKVFPTTTSNLKIKVTYNQGSQEKTQDIQINPTFAFQTIQAVVKLIDHAGIGLAGGRVDQGGGYWQHHGYTDANGEVKLEMFPDIYKFRMSYNHTSQEKWQNVATPVVFQTGQVHWTSASPRPIKAALGGTWVWFSQDMELLPGTYKFVFDDGSDQMVTVTAGMVTNIPLNDCEKPSITCPTDVTVCNDPSKCTAVVTWPTPTATGNPAPTVWCEPASGSTFPVGTTQVTCYAQNSCGTASCTFNVTVNDGENPTITCPADVDVTVCNDPDKCYATGVLLGTPTVSDNCDPNPSVTNNAPAQFPPGVTTVTWTVTDAAGNSNTCTQNVRATYRFIGFLPPVDNPPVWNFVKAGRTIPVKWQLMDANGTFISSLDVVKYNPLRYRLIPCSGPGDNALMDGDTSGSSGLRYDSTTNQYIFNWQTSSAFAKCYELLLELDDGTTHSAFFNFIK